MKETQNETGMKYMLFKISNWSGARIENGVSPQHMRCGAWKCDCQPTGKSHLSGTKQETPLHKIHLMVPVFASILFPTYMQC